MIHSQILLMVDSSDQVDMGLDKPYSHRSNELDMGHMLQPGCGSYKYLNKLENTWWYNNSFISILRILDHLIPYKILWLYIVQFEIFTTTLMKPIYSTVDIYTFMHQWKYLNVNNKSNLSKSNLSLVRI